MLLTVVQSVFAIVQSTGPWKQIRGERCMPTTRSAFHLSDFVNLSTWCPLGAVDGRLVQSWVYVAVSGGRGGWPAEYGALRRNMVSRAIFLLAMRQVLDGVRE